MPFERSISRRIRYQFDGAEGRKRLWPTSASLPSTSGTQANTTVAECGGSHGATSAWDALTAACSGASGFAATLRDNELSEPSKDCHGSTLQARSQS